jgi:hypothetical protein
VRDRFAHDYRQVSLPLVRPAPAQGTCLLSCSMRFAEIRHRAIGVALGLVDLRTRVVTFHPLLLRNRLVEVGERICVVFLLRPAHPAGGQRFRIFRLDLQRLIEVRHGAIEVALAQQSLAAQQIREGIVDDAPIDHLIKRHDRAFVLAGRHHRHPAPQRREQVGRTVFERPIEVGGGFRRAAFRQQRPAAFGQGLSVLRTDRERTIVLRQRLLDLALAHIDDAAPDIAAGFLRIEGDGTVVFRQRFLALALEPECPPAADERARVFRVDDQRAVEIGERGIVLLAGSQDGPAGHQHRRVLRDEPDQLIEIREHLLSLVLLQANDHPQSQRRHQSRVERQRLVE